MNELQSTIISKIVEHVNAGFHARDESVSWKKRALLHAVSAGHYLVEAKQTVGHGSWLLWFEENIRSNSSLVGNFSIQTAHRWMGLTLLPPEVLDTLDNKKEAYVALEMLHKEETRHINRDPSGTNWIGIVSNLTIKFEHLLDTRPLREWEEQERLILVERLRPMAKRFVEAGGTL